MKKWMLLAVLNVLLVYAGTAFAHVLEVGWWDAQMETLKEAREQIRLFMENGQGDMVNGVLAPEWKASSAEELSSAMDQLSGVIGDAVQVGDIVLFGRYEQNNIEGDGKEPIQWTVLEIDGNKALLLSVYGLDAKPFNEENADVTWETCTLRKWLNGEFLETAFTDFEQEKILTTVVDNSNEQGYKALEREVRVEDGNRTEDKLFLLSVAEVKKYYTVEQEGDYIFTTHVPGISLESTAYTAAQWTFVEDGKCSMALRSPSMGHLDAYATITSSGYFFNEPVSSPAVMFPALWVDLSAIRRLGEEPEYETYGTMIRATYDSGNVFTGNMRDGVKSGWGKMVYSRGEVYEGEWEEDKPNGQGTYTRVGGETYVGEWRDGEKNGYGKTAYANGNVYVGEWKENKRNGQGTLTYGDGGRYAGQWEEDEISGQGVMTYTDGNVYEGEWENGRRNGQGTMTYADGRSYTGQWKNDRRDGHGIMSYWNISVYDGEWVEDEKSGQGILTYWTGAVYTDEWEADRSSGQGIMTYAPETLQENELEGGRTRETETYTNGNVYYGELSDGVRNGWGSMVHANGCVYEGEWKAGRRDGQGTFAWPDGDFYTGEFIEDTANGQGTYTWANGTVYVGEWKDGNRNGYGKNVYANGDVYEGEWRDDVRNGQGTLTYVTGRIESGRWEDGKFVGD